jgi:hypothetical protein
MILWETLRFDTAAALKAFGAFQPLPQFKLYGVGAPIFQHRRRRRGDNWAPFDGDIIVQLASGKSAEEVQRRLPAVMKKYYGNLRHFLERYKSTGMSFYRDKAEAYQFELRPLKEMYLGAPVLTRLQNAIRFRTLLGGIALLCWRLRASIHDSTINSQS